MNKYCLLLWEFRNAWNILYFKRKLSQLFFYGSNYLGSTTLYNLFLCFQVASKINKFLYKQQCKRKTCTDVLLWPQRETEWNLITLLNKSKYYIKWTNIVYYFESSEMRGTFFISKESCLSCFFFTDQITLVLPCYTICSFAFKLQAKCNIVPSLMFNIQSNPSKFCYRQNWASNVDKF